MGCKLKEAAHKSHHMTGPVPFPNWDQDAGALCPFDRRPKTENHPMTEETPASTLILFVSLCHHRMAIVGAELRAGVLWIGILESREFEHVQIPVASSF